MSEQFFRSLEPRRGFPPGKPVQTEFSLVPDVVGSKAREVEQSRVGKIDQYNPSVHVDAARFIEPRLATLSSREAEERRRYIGIIPSQGTDWVFVEVGELPIETDTPGNQGSFIRDTSSIPSEAYASNNGVYIVNAGGRFYISALEKLTPAGDMVIANGSTPLIERRFKKVSGNVPFPSSDGLAVKAAVLNAVAPNLAEDYFPHVPEAKDYRFYNDGNGEVLAGIPSTPSVHILQLSSPSH